MPTNDGSPSVDVDHAIKSWRYLRLAIVVLAVALLLSLLLELWRAEWNLLPSISAYYYTPVHSIFVGAMVMIGACLLAIRGLTDREDVMLNLAGLLAPVVALAPTVAPDPETYIGDLLTIDVKPLANNNLAALLVAAIVVGVGSNLLVRRLTQRASAKPDARSSRSSTMHADVKRGWTMGGVIVVAGTTIYLIWETKPLHNFAAILMFVCLWRVVVYNASGNHPRIKPIAIWKQALRFPKGGYPSTYAWIALWMLVGPLLVGLAAVVSPAAKRNYTFWLELVEIVPFVAFWLAQTMQRWYE